MLELQIMSRVKSTPWLMKPREQAEFRIILACYSQFCPIKPWRKITIVCEYVILSSATVFQTLCYTDCPASDLQYKLDRAAWFDKYSFTCFIISYLHSFGSLLSNHKTEQNQLLDCLYHQYHNDIYTIVNVLKC